ITGEFPNIEYSYKPTFCNHCDNAPCVEACPVDPKAIFKDSESNLVLMDADRCIGCRNCENECPYGVISYNAEEAHPFWRDEKGQEMVEDVGGNVIPYYNPNRARTWDGIRREEVVEKCTFCDHRLAEGLNPYCVESCPAQALNFGDLDDTSSEVYQLLEEYEATRLKEDQGTEPNVYYIREFSKLEKQ
ncbi:4Fe-4S dicluster domain-containing protein, partial [Halarsenatibacter silvermanii]